MKQLTFEDVISAFKDEPTSIGDRLESLGFPQADLKKKFSSEVLQTVVYGSSFLKFLQDNAQALDGIDRGIPAKELPPDFKNPFDDEPETLSKRLNELGIGKKELKEMFSDDTLNLSLNGDEFQDFISQNQDKFLGKLEKLATRGEQNA